MRRSGPFRHQRNVFWRTKNAIFFFSQPNWRAYRPSLPVRSPKRVFPAGRRSHEKAVSPPGSAAEPPPFRSADPMQNEPPFPHAVPAQKVRRHTESQAPEATDIPGKFSENLRKDAGIARQAPFFPAWEHKELFPEAHGSAPRSFPSERQVKWNPSQAVPDSEAPQAETVRVSKVPQERDCPGKYFAGSSHLPQVPRRPAAVNRGDRNDFLPKRLPPERQASPKTVWEAFPGKFRKPFQTRSKQEIFGGSVILNSCVNLKLFPVSQWRTGSSQTRSVCLPSRAG